MVLIRNGGAGNMDELLLQVDVCILSQRLYFGQAKTVQPEEKCHFTGVPLDRVQEHEDL